MAIKDQFFFQRAAAIEDRNQKFITGLCFTLLGISLSLSDVTAIKNAAYGVILIVAWICFLTAGFISHFVSERNVEASIRRATIDDYEDQYQKLGSTAKDAVEKFQIQELINGSIKEADTFNSETDCKAGKALIIMGIGLGLLMAANGYLALCT